ncbi:MAG: hypothetical protein JWN14_4427, partial [Chthonomonadales bacterium]|nr:hypothetical protein [Chthonomonadales bacterium]
PLPLLHHKHNILPPTYPSVAGPTSTIRLQPIPALATPSSFAQDRAGFSSPSVGSVSPRQAASDTVTSPAEPTKQGFHPMTFASLLILCWGVGVAGFMARMFVGFLTLRRWKQGSREAPQTLYETASNAGNPPNDCRPITLRIAAADSGLRVPITWGIARPIVLLPVDYALETTDRCRAALLHELAHVRRRDWAWLLLAQSLCALYWCVPFVWMAARRLSHETELACDDRVLSAGISAPDYAEQILEVVRNMQSENRRLPRIAMPMARRPLAETRIRAILDPIRPRQSNSRIGLILAALLPVLCVPILSLRVVAAPETPPMAQDIKLSVPEESTPLSAELNSEPMASSPLTINKTPLQPSLPPAGLSNGVETVSNPNLLRQPTLPVTPSLAAAAPPNESVPVIAWGPVVNGLQAGLRLVGTKEAYGRGEPIWQETYLRNKSTEEVSIRASGGYESQGDPVITNAKGARVKVLHYFGMGAMFVVSTSVRPGEIAMVGRFAVAFHDALHPKEVAPGLSSYAEEIALALSGPGRYMLSQELSPTDAKGKSLKKTVRTGAVPIQIGDAPALEIRLTDHNHISDLSTATIAWGMVRSGLQVGLFPLETRREYFAGERVRVAVILRNVSEAPIQFWHQTSFAFMETPQVTDSAGGMRAASLAPETEWRIMSGIRMTGVTFDMTYAPSADGPSRLRRSEIAPGQSVLGYCLVGFVVPPRWPDGMAVPGRYHLVQPFRIGIGKEELLDTTLETGGMELNLADPDARISLSNRLFIRR